MAETIKNMTTETQKDTSKVTCYNYKKKTGNLDNTSSHKTSCYFSNIYINNC